eukprot:TRINITY_DN368_c0_g1_i3.p1 TRINITY_DN368_c0_g1~~TRINITY_DN368_c0_g1_i3.p1  ORF type:complete len:234 (-),score=-19.99 TRINITY_DN368_c0_g1_i3:183-884(-)
MVFFQYCYLIFQIFYLMVYPISFLAGSRMGFIIHFLYLLKRRVLRSIYYEIFFIKPFISKGLFTIWRFFRNICSHEKIFGQLLQLARFDFKASIFSLKSTPCPQGPVPKNIISPKHYIFRVSKHFSTSRIIQIFDLIRNRKLILLKKKLWNNLFFKFVDCFAQSWGRIRTFDFVIQVRMLNHLGTKKGTQFQFRYNNIPYIEFFCQEKYFQFIFDEITNFVLRTKSIVLPLAK